MKNSGQQVSFLAEAFREIINSQVRFDGALQNFDLKRLAFTHVQFISPLIFVGTYTSNTRGLPLALFAKLNSS